MRPRSMDLRKGSARWLVSRSWLSAAASLASAAASPGRGADPCALDSGASAMAFPPRARRRLATPYSKVETDDKLRAASDREETRRGAGLSGRLAAVMNEPPRTPPDRAPGAASAPRPGGRAASLVLCGADLLAAATRTVAR